MRRKQKTLSLDNRILCLLFALVIASNCRHLQAQTCEPIKIGEWTVAGMGRVLTHQDNGLTVFTIGQFSIVLHPQDARTFQAKLDPARPRYFVLLKNAYAPITQDLHALDYFEESSPATAWSEYDRTYKLGLHTIVLSRDPCTTNVLQEFDKKQILIVFTTRSPTTY